MRSSDRFSGLQAKLAVHAYRRPLLWLAISALTSGIAFWQGRALQIDPEVKSLLPQSSPSVQNLERLSREFGGIGWLTMVVSGAEPSMLKRFARDLAPRIEKIAAVRYVEYRRPLAFFEQRLHLFLALDTLQTVLRRVSARADYERRRARGETPLPAVPPSLDLREIIRRDQERHPTPGRVNSRYYLDPLRNRLLLFVKPRQSPTNLAFGRRLIADVRAAIAQLDARRYGAGLTIRFAGRHKQWVERLTLIEQDVGRTATLAVILILCYLALHFRRISAIPLLILPMAAALCWTIGSAALFFDKLNILSAFIGVMLLGLGVDHGIHLLTRYQEQRAREPGEMAIDNTYRFTGNAVVIAALTTTVGFLGLTSTEFAGFRQFGVIAGVGMVYFVLAFHLVLPALLALAERWQFSPPRPDRSHPGKSPLIKKPRATFIGALAAFLLACVGIPWAHMDFDIDRLDRDNLPARQLAPEITAVLGHTQAPLVILTANATEAASVQRELQRRKQRAGARSGIHFTISIANFVPPNQSRKVQLASQIAAQLRSFDLLDLPPRDRASYRRLLALSNVPAFGPRDLPDTITRQFRSATGTGNYVLVFPNFVLAEWARSRALARDLSKLPLPGGRQIAAAGPIMILSEILELVLRAAPLTTGIASVLVFAVMWLFFGRIRLALVCMLPPALTLAAATGLMGLSGATFNPFNTVVMPVLFGLGVDGAVHMVAQLSEDETMRGLQIAGRAIAGSLLTTAFGFGTLLLSSHGGLRSVAELTLLGLALNALACLLLLPALLAWKGEWFARR